jgi:hypothetical protein
MQPFPPPPPAIFWWFSCRDFGTDITIGARQIRGARAAIWRRCRGDAKLNTKLLASGTALIVIIGGVVALSVHTVRTPPPPPPKPASPAVAPVAPASCLLPGPPPVPPQGAVASAADMRLGHDVMQNFVLRLEAYQTCRNDQIDHAAASVTDAQKEQWLQQGNDAIDEANMLAGAFKVQLEAFRKKNPGQ